MYYSIPFVVVEPGAVPDVQDALAHGAQRLQAALEGGLDGQQAAGQLLLLVPPAQARQRGHLQRALLAPGKLLLAVTHLHGGTGRDEDTGDKSQLNAW